MSCPRWKWRSSKCLSLWLLLAAIQVSLTRADELPASSNSETEKTFALAAYREWKGEKIGYSDVTNGQPALNDSVEPSKPDIMPRTMKGQPIRVPTSDTQSSCESCCLPCCDDGCGREGFFDNVSFFSALDAFKGPLDLDGLNGNFGTRTGMMGAFPVLPRFGLGLQGGTSVAWYDPNGSLYTGSSSRFQNFTNVGVFQRTLDNRFSWGFCYDWLFDHYYSNMQFGQYRMKGGMMVGTRNELGIWAAVPQRRDSSILPGPALNTFRPMSQGSLYWQHYWRGTASTQAWVGVAEKPGIFVCGATAFVPMGAATALTGTFNFITPDNLPGQPRRQNEVWNVSVGLAFYPTARADRAVTNRFRPVLSMPDNGTFAVRRY
jgi:hypothetical protein